MSPRHDSAGSRPVQGRDADTASTRSPISSRDEPARQIQAEIADTREELSETIDALQEKLRPSNIVSDATDRVKTATTEKVSHG